MWRTVLGLEHVETGEQVLRDQVEARQRADLHVDSWMIRAPDVLNQPAQMRREEASDLTDSARTTHHGWQAVRPRGIR